MKTRTTIALLIIVAGLLAFSLTGCAKNAPNTNGSNIETQVTDTLSPEITASNPDIGALDDSQVSDELPQ